MGVALPVVAAPKPAEVNPDVSALTAEEMLNRGRVAYAAAKYEEAEGLFQGFLSQYGASPEALEALPRMLPMLAISRIQLRKYDGALEAILEYFQKTAKPEPAVAEELLFWQGMCELHAEQFEAAHKSFRTFLDTHPKSPKCEEVILLLAAGDAVAGKHAAAIQFLSDTKAGLSPENRGRATVQQLYSLLESGRREDALKLLLEEYPRSADILQLVSFNSLALRLGADFLEDGKYRESIACLQRVWPRDRLLRHQEARLEELRARLAAARERNADARATLTLSQMVAKVEREVSEFRKSETFECYDSSLRLRLASAFLGMERHREAALILEQMLDELPPDPVVEDASLTLIQCWTRIERWDRAIAAAERFAVKFPKSKHLAMIGFLRGVAEQNAPKLAESIATFDAVAEKYPDADIAPRAFFMKGFSLLLAEQNADAIGTFEKFPRRFKKDDLAEDALYWRGMGYSLAKDPTTSRRVMAEYLKKYPKGKYAADAVFRRAYSAQAAQDFDTAIRELGKYLKEYPDHTGRAEALVLLGDAHMADGDLDKGIDAFKRIEPAQTRFFEEGWFKTGKALKLQEKHTALRKHMEEFVAQHADSPRLPEAIYWIGWTHRQADRDKEAVAVYWDAIDRFGNSARHRAVEDLFPALAKLYPGDDGRRTYLGRLEALAAGAKGDDNKTLRSRALWAQAKVWERREPARAILLLVEAAPLLDPTTASPQMLADCADALRVQNDDKGAADLYTGLLQWNPRAVQRDRAFAGLGLLAGKAGDQDAALDYYAKFEERTVGSPLLGRVLMNKAALLAARRKYKDAAIALERVVADEQVTKQEKAEALVQYGDLFMREDKPAGAIAYYQRVYVMYGRWPRWVARSYLRSGEAFEKLRRTDEAIRTYEELLGREDLASSDEARQAKKKLAALKGGA